MVIVEINYHPRIGIIIKGHSGYEELGKDIVCSAISSVLTQTVILLKKFNIKFNYKLEPADSYIKLLDKELTSEFNLDESTKIMESLIEFLKMTEKEYPKYLKIGEKK